MITPSSSPNTSLYSSSPPPPSSFWCSSCLSTTFLHATPQQSHVLLQFLHAASGIMMISKHCYCQLSTTMSKGITMAKKITTTTKTASTSSTCLRINWLDFCGISHVGKICLQEETLAELKKKVQSFNLFKWILWVKASLTCEPKHTHKQYTI